MPTTQANRIGKPCRSPNAIVNSILRYRSTGFLRPNFFCNRLLNVQRENRLADFGEHESSIRCSARDKSSAMRRSELTRTWLQVKFSREKFNPCDHYPICRSDRTASVLLNQVGLLVAVEPHSSSSAGPLRIDSSSNSCTQGKQFDWRRQTLPGKVPATAF